MPEKEGAEENTTKSVVNKKQKQMMGEEGYDHLRDMGRIRKNKKKKDATTMPPSKEMEKTRKVNKGPSALELVKKKYKGQIMDVKKEELDLTQVAETFGGFIVEKENIRNADQAAKIAKARRKLKMTGDAVKPAEVQGRQDATDPRQGGYSRVDDKFDAPKGKTKLPTDPGQLGKAGEVKTYNVKDLNKTKNRKPRTIPFKSKKTLSPEVQKKVDAVKRDIDTRELINPDRRSRKRVSRSGTKFKTPSVRPKAPTFEKTPIKLTKPSDVELPQSFKDFDRKLKSTRQSFARQRVGTSARTKNVIKNITKGPFPPPPKPTKATMKTIGKVGGRKLAKTGVKIGAKALGKTALKQIPFLGQAIAGAEAVGRFASGDAVGAGIALASAIPGIGIGADAANAVRDIRRATKLARKAKTLTKVTRTGRTIQGANVIKRFKRSKTAKVPKFLKTKKGRLAAQLGGAIATPTVGGLIQGALGGAKKAGDAVGHVGRRSAGSM